MAPVGRSEGEPMTNTEIYKECLKRLDDDEFWSKNAADLAEFIGCGDIAQTPEASDEVTREMFRQKFRDAILGQPQQGGGNE
jgi:hypothetical protein